MSYFADAGELVDIVTANNLDTKQENKRAWWVVELDLDQQQEDIASWLMIHLGANGCQLIPSSDGLLTLQASFEPRILSPERLPELCASLDEYGLAAVAGSLRINKIEEEDWLSEWKKGLQPLKLGEHFLVSPPWFKGQIPQADLDGRHVIWIEPGMAFGTGFHFTTQFCLRAVENHLKPGTSILDVGTGSGILAIAAALSLPHCRITAVEIDPIACRVANENLELNQVNEQVTLVEGSLERVSGQKFEAVLSNLTCEDNIAHLPQYAELLTSGGKAILSGVLAEKAPALESSLADHQFRVIYRELDGIWSGFVLERL